MTNFDKLFVQSVGGKNYNKIGPCFKFSNYIRAYRVMGYLCMYIVVQVRSKGYIICRKLSNLTHQASSEGN